ncbi:MAG: serine hydrolase [Acidobacteriota bacterium]|nr:serine hydrolase [Acidobacteriota bacterium]MDH3784994.1 serine hydrolase [Acidobacteriota bacterium]
MKRKALAHLVALFLLFLLLVAPAPAAAKTDSDLEARLAELVERMEQRREELHIPGMALVVVKGDEVILARGFGVTDMESNNPVTDETLFMIGSTTKAFTSMLVGMMVDADKMAWDSPIADYIPYFDPTVDSEDEDARVTVRDALSHRSGFSRMGMLLTAQDVDPTDVLKVANGAEAFDGYHQAFHYNNIMFLAAGTASAKVANSDWHRLVRKRIFKPLGMTSSSTESAKIRGDLVPGYAWQEDLGELDRQPVLPIDVAAPAGAIVSNATDMGKWLRFLNGKGTYRGKQLVDDATIAEMWTSNIEIAENFGYGMGWFVREWNGHKMLEHGGNINGFSAEVGLLPDDDIGFALMTNLTATALQQESLEIVFESLLGEGESTTTDPEADTHETDEAAESLTAFLGDYVAEFGAFKDATFAVSEQDGVLFVNVPGQTNYEIRPVGDDGRRPFAVTDTVAVSFEANEDGSVDLMRMHQGGLDFELPRRGVVIEPEIDLDELAPFLGTYHSETFNGDVPVRIKNNRLAVDIPGQMAFELRLPDEDGRRRFRIREVISVSFEMDDDGRVASMTLYEGDDQSETMPRSGDPDGKPLPTVSELMAVRASDARVAAMKAMGGVMVTSRLQMVHAGLSGTSTTWGDGTRFRSESDFGRFGWVHIALTPEMGQMQTHVTPIDAIEGRRLSALIELESVAQNLDWREHFDSVKVLRWETRDDQSLLLVQLRNGDAPVIRALVDTETGDIVEYESSIPIPGANTEIPITVTLEDYREVEGVRIPFRSVAVNPESGSTVTEIDTIKTGQTLCDALFELGSEPDCAAM